MHEIDQVMSPFGDQSLRLQQRGPERMVAFARPARSPFAGGLVVAWAHPSP
jgi:hypothetical protein